MRPITGARLFLISQPEPQIFDTMPTLPKKLNLTAQIAATGGLLVLFPLLIWHAGHAGYASLLSTYAARVNQIAPANAAVNSAPGDPEGHYLRGAILEANDDLTGAIAEYDLAASLRPDDYVPWLTLAHARELSGDKAGALAAARQAVPLAPFYAQPHWQLGNILVRAGQRDEGFKELRLAGASNPILLPGIVELAWQLYGSDAHLVKQAIQPQSPEAYRVLAESFRKHGKTEDAIAMLSASGGDAEAVRAREQYLNELISTKRFKEAYALWSQGRSSNSSGGLGVIIDSGFEQESNLDRPGFGWRVENKSPSLSFSLDPANPKEGHSSLRIEFKGDSDPGQKIVSQLVLLEPRTHYQLEFAARTENLVSGGLPSITVTDASDNVTLGRPVLLPQQADNWQHYAIDFNSKEATTAIHISLQRERCSNSPCPIFGRLWLDSFSLQKR